MYYHLVLELDAFIFKYKLSYSLNSVIEQLEKNLFSLEEIDESLRIIDVLNIFKNEDFLSTYFFEKRS
jgi:hypothetical protein